MTQVKNFNRCSVIIALLLQTLLSCTTNKTIEENETVKKHNVLFIFTDDQTYSTIHALGNDEIKTPNMDRLVAGGTTFNQTFNMGGWNGAICAASRSMINSGRSIWKVSKFRNHWSQGDSIDLTWGQMMKQAGYDTYMTGKWHVDELSAKDVFDTAIHVRKGMPNDYRREKGAKRLGYNRPLSKDDTMWSPTNPKFGGYWEGGTHWSEVVKNDALMFLDQSKDSDNPFFMYLAFSAPHDPRQAPQEYQDLYDIDSISLPLSYRPDHPYRSKMGNPKSLRDEALAPFPRTKYAIKVHTKEYYALISHLDAQIGEILDRLEASGQKDNTYIFFTSDHGLAMGRHGLIGKQSMYDHSVRPPLVVVGPDIPANQRLDQEVYLQDVMPSALDIAGIIKPNFVDFNSLLPIARGEQLEGNYPAIYGAYIKVQRMIRKEGFKLIVYPKADKILLFDLQKDPEEMNDLFENPAYKDKAKELAEGLVELQRQHEDPLDLTPVLAQVFN